MIRSIVSVLLAATSAAASDPPESVDSDDPFAGNSCIECHRDLVGRPSEIVELEWARSAHYASGVACDGCHGGDPSLKREQFESADAWKEAAHLQRDPEFMFMHRPDGVFVSAARGRSVSYFCGKCHADIKEKHLGSPHGEIGDPTCLYCHGQGSHAIQDPTLDLIDTRSRAEGGRCSLCHMASTMETVSRIKELLIETEERIARSEHMYDELTEWRYHNLELEQLHGQAKEIRSQLRQIFHSFNMRDISNFTAEIEEAVNRTTTTHEIVGNLRRAQRRQARDGAMITAGLLAFAGLLVFYRHAFLHGQEERGSKEATSS